MLILADTKTPAFCGQKCQKILTIQKVLRKVIGKLESSPWKNAPKMMLCQMIGNEIHQPENGLFSTKKIHFTTSHYYFDRFFFLKHFFIFSSLSWQIDFDSEKKSERISLSSSLDKTLFDVPKKSSTISYGIVFLLLIYMDRVKSVQFLERWLKKWDRLAQLPYEKRFIERPWSIPSWSLQ